MGKINYEQTAQGYGIITIDHRAKRHAISYSMAMELNEILKQLLHDPVTCLILRSNGSNVFCAGGNLNDFNANLDEETAYELLKLMKEILYRIISFPVPTICLMHGNAYGGGCELATACDIRIAKSGTKFGFIQAKLGILPAWGGGAILYEKVLPSFAFNWITSGQVYTAETLLEKGWIQQVVSEEVWENEHLILKEYLTNSLQQMQSIKKQYIARLNLPKLKVKMEEEISETAALWGSKTHKMIVGDFLNKR